MLQKRDSVKEEGGASVYAVVTGGSRGLGRAFAEELSRQGISTVLISSNERIAEVCEALRTKYNVDSQYVVADLTKEESVLEAARIINERYSVFLLVNNAGIGGTQRFDEVSVERLQQILHLNVLATTLLCRQLLPNLLGHARSYILNVSSLAALTPTGYKMAYPASKAFVRHFSYGLRAEMKGCGLSVSVVSPGAMATSPDICRRIEKQGFWGRLTLSSVERVARKCVRQTLRGRKEIIVAPLSYVVSRLLPASVRTPILTRIVRRETCRANEGNGKVAKR